MKERPSQPASKTTGPRPSLRPLLYVEDNDDNWAVAQLRLGDRFELIRAATDREACASLTKDGQRLCAILMDIELQGSRLNGIDITRLIRGINQRVDLPEYAKTVPRLDTPLIFITAYNQVHPEEELKAAGGDMVMAKPVDFRALNMALMKLLVDRLNRGRKTAG